MHWPQITWIVLAAMGFTIHAVKHGQPIKDKYSMWVALARVVLTVTLLWNGGFFNPANAQVPANAQHYRADLLRAAHNQWGLDAPVPALAAQVHQESGWNPNAVSRVGAAGLSQFMPTTAQWWCKVDQGSAQDCQPKNPTWALRAMVGYDRYLFVRTPERFNTYDRMWVALRGYNGGLGHWQLEAKSTGLPLPSRSEVDAACGKARRSSVHCPENLGYPQRILNKLQPMYANWGISV